MTSRMEVTSQDIEEVNNKLADMAAIKTLIQNAVENSSVLGVDAAYKKRNILIF